jgi:N-formylglutamate amidohydrolase
VLSFLRVPEPDAATMQKMVAAEVQNKKPYTPMRADTKQLLESFYAPFNAALAEQLADERWKWAT